jgi:Beta-lactamase
MWPRAASGRSSIRRFLSVVILLLIVAGCVVFRPDRALRTATGMVAHDLCSETFLAGLDPEQTYEESIVPRPGMRRIAWAIRHNVDREKRDVQASFFGAIASRAVFRDGLGCMLVHGDEIIDRPAPVAIDYETGSIVAHSTVVAAATPALAAAVNAAFLEPANPPHRWTKAVVVVHDGKIVAERYAPGYGIETPILGFSMTKSVTNALVGILVHQGKLAVAKPASLAAWQGADDPRRSITLEHLMRMESGLALDETGSGFDPSNQMFYDEAHMAEYAMRAAPAAAPGRRWSYSSASTHLVSRIVRDSVGGTGEAVQYLAHRELFAPLGMRHVTLEIRPTVRQRWRGKRQAPFAERLGALVVRTHAWHCLRCWLVEQSRWR